MKKYIDGLLIFIGLIILILIISNLYLNNQKSINNQQSCLKNKDNPNSEFYDKKIYDCNNY